MSLMLLNGNERKLLAAAVEQGTSSRPKLQKASGVEPCRMATALMNLEMLGLVVVERKGSRKSYAPTAKAIRAMQKISAVLREPE